VSGQPLVMPAAFEKTTVAAAAGAPNVMVFLVDDLGHGDVSFMGSDAADDMAKATPTLSGLAASGVILSSFYASPTCTPSRASFLTGKYPTSLGLQDSVIQATEPRGLNLDEDLLPERLAAVGYRTLGVKSLLMHVQAMKAPRGVFFRRSACPVGAGLPVMNAPPPPTPPQHRTAHTYMHACGTPHHSTHLTTTTRWESGTWAFTWRSTPPRGAASRSILGS